MTWWEQRGAWQLGTVLPQLFCRCGTIGSCDHNCPKNIAITVNDIIPSGCSRGLVDNYYQLKRVLSLQVVGFQRFLFVGLGVWQWFEEQLLTVNWLLTQYPSQISAGCGVQLNLLSSCVAKDCYFLGFAVLVDRGLILCTCLFWWLSNACYITTVCSLQSVHSLLRHDEWTDTAAGVSIVLFHWMHF